jgi:aminoglycoside 6'-N-acetyltransferase
MSRRDLSLVDAWLSQSHVAEWWHEHALGIDAAASFGPSIDGEDPMEVFVVDWDGRPIGLVQRYRMADEPAYAAALGGDLSRAVGIDYLVGEPDAVGMGIGPRVIDAFSADTFATMDTIDEIVVAVQQANRRSWRALEKAGYTRVFAGMIDTGDPSDTGPSYVYRRRR